MVGAKTLARHRSPSPHSPSLLQPPTHCGGPESVPPGSVGCPDTRSEHVQRSPAKQSASVWHCRRKKQLGSSPTPCVSVVIQSSAPQSLQPAAIPLGGHATTSPSSGGYVHESRASNACHASPQSSSPTEADSRVSRATELTSTVSSQSPSPSPSPSPRAFAFA
jgi:hypothetical protein